MADLTARIRAKLDEVRHRKDCASQVASTDPGYVALHRVACDCDHPQRVADLVRRMIERFGLARAFAEGTSASCWEAALAVPSEEENRG